MNRISKMLLKTLIILLIIQVNLINSESNDPIVCLPELGCVQGTYMNGYQTEQFEAFLGVPFAEPPIGPLRFKNPVPVKPWNAVLLAKTPKPDCIQKNYLLDDPFVTGEEDCLYMNIYRPTPRSDKPLPVMFYIFGGGYFAGSASPDMMDPAYFMDTQEVLLVLTNYRLGPFGFLSTGSVEMPGNQGLKDQQLALKWIQTNIAAFGGDPQSVTLFGHSAGGSSAHFHMLSKGSENLFHAVILGSGTAISPFVDIIQEPYEQALKIAESLEIEHAAEMDKKELVKMLQSFDPHTLITAGDVLKSWHRFPLFNFRPTIEDANWPDAFLIDLPKELLKTGKIYKVSTIYTVVSYSGEGAVYTLRIWTHKELLDEFNADFEERLWFLMELPIKTTAEKKSKILNLIVEEYFGGIREVNNSTMQGFTELFTDIGFFYPFWKGIKDYILHPSATAPLYMVYFNYTGPKSHAFIYNGGTPIDFGVVHMDELPYLFRSPILFPGDFEKNSVDARLVKDFVGLYVDFAKTGEIQGLDFCTKEIFDSRSDSQAVCDFIEYQNKVDRDYIKVVHTDMDTKRMKMLDKILEGEL